MAWLGTLIMLASAQLSNSPPQPRLSVVVPGVAPLSSPSPLGDAIVEMPVAAGEENWIDVEVHVSLSQEAEGWSISLANDSSLAVDTVTVNGVMVSTVYDHDDDPSTPDLDPYLLDLGHSFFARSYLATGDYPGSTIPDARGVVSGVVLASTPRMVLHGDATHAILRLVYRASPVAEGAVLESRVYFLDGLTRGGQPISNVVTLRGTNTAPETRGLTLRLRGAPPGFQRARVAVANTSAAVGEGVDVPVRLSSSAAIEGFVLALDWDAAIAKGLGIHAPLEELGPDVVVSRIEESYAVAAVLMDSDGIDGEVIPAGEDREVVRLSLQCVAEGQTAVRFADWRYSLTDNGPVQENYLIQGGVPLRAPGELGLTSGVLESRGEGGRQVPGDCNQDGRLDVSDAACLFGVLFLGQPAEFPCGDGSPGDSGNLSLVDWQPDGAVDISDGTGLLGFLFLGTKAHPRSAPQDPLSACVRLAGCPESSSCVP